MFNHNKIRNRGRGRQIWYGDFVICPFLRMEGVVWRREREREREKLTQLTISYSIWPPFVVKSSNLRTYAFKVKDRLHMGGGAVVPCS